MPLGDRPFHPPMEEAHPRERRKGTTGAFWWILLGVVVMVAMMAVVGGLASLKFHRTNANAGTKLSWRTTTQRPLKSLGAVVLLAPERHVGSIWGIDRFCLLLRAVRSIDRHLNAHYGPYPIYVLVAKDYASNPRTKDGPYTPEDRALIARWAPSSTVVFVEVELYTNEALEPHTSPSQILSWRKGADGAVPGRDLGYTSMCRLWSGRLQTMSFLDAHDYYLRMDDDSLFTENLPWDPFVTLQHRNKIYAYKRDSMDHWGVDQLWKVAEPHLDLTKRDLPPFWDPITSDYTGGQPYNNFHVSRVDFWRRPSWTALWKDMNEAHLFFKYRVGDANVHAMALLMMGTQNYEVWSDLPYVHNSNDYGPKWGTKAWAEECQTDYDRFLPQA